MRAPETAGVDPSVLGRILLLQSGLEAAPDEQHVNDMLVRGLNAAPGIRAIKAAAPGDSLPTHGSMQANGNANWRFALKTAQGDYGSLTFDLASVKDFEPYAPFIENTVNLAALQIEKMRVSGQLRQANRHLETLARQSSTQYQLLFEQMSEGVIYQDKQGKAITANPAALRILGLDSPVELQGSDSPWQHPVREDGRALPPAEHPCSLALESRRSVSGTVLGIRRHGSGKLVWLNVNAVPLPATNESEGDSVCATFHDVTEIRERQSQLHQINFAMDQVRESAFLIDKDGNFAYVNDEACRVLGYSRDELIGGMGIPDISSWTTEEWGKHWNEITAKTSMVFEACQRTKDGRDIPVEINAACFDYNGRTFVLGLVRDISRRKRTETALRENEARMKLFIEHAPVPLAMFDRDMRYMMVSHRWLTTYGLEGQNLIGRSHYEVLPEIPENWKTFHQRGLAGETVHADEDPFERADGRIQWIRWEIRPWHTDGGEVGGIILFTEDITKLKHSEDKVTEYVKQLEESMEGTLLAVSNMVEQRDPYTAGHERRVGIIAADIGREMGWHEKKCMELQMIGLVHDIGKIGVPSEILTKPGRLTSVEYNLVREHVVKGYEILKDVKFPLPIADIIHQHHERMDGSGYPRGLKGNEILPEARVLAVADVMESMASYRPYRPALGLDAALEEIRRHRATLYDTDVVEALLRLIDKGYQMPS